MHAMNPTTQNFHLSKFAITLGTSKFQLSQFWAWRRVGLELPHPITNCDLWRLYSKVSKSSELVCKWSGRWTKINVFLLKRSQRPYGQLCHNLPRMEFTFPTHTSPISSQHMSFLRACCELRAIIEGLFLIGHEARKFELRPSTIEKICPIQKSDHIYKTHMPYIDINVGSSVTSFKTIISNRFLDGGDRWFRKKLLATCFKNIIEIWKYHPFLFQPQNGSNEFHSIPSFGTSMFLLKFREITTHLFIRSISSDSNA